MQKRILVVDDDISNCIINTESLEQVGYIVDAADNGAVAWQALNTHNYDLLVIDNNLPRMSGVELVKKLRDANIAVPVIIAAETLAVIRTREHSGLDFTATLLKPYTITELLHTVKLVLAAGMPDG